MGRTRDDGPMARRGSTASGAHVDEASVVRAAVVPELAAAAGRLEMAGSLEDVLEVAAECAIEVLGASNAAVCRIEQATCHPVAVCPPPEGVREVVMARTSFRAEDRPALLALIRDRQPWVANAYAPDGSLREPGDPAAGDVSEVHTLLQLGAASAMAVPVVLHGTVWGELFATRREPGAQFGDDELAAGTVLAGLLAGAVARADLESQVRHLVAEDPLTGLANRRVADAAAEHALAGGQETCVVMCDVDGLKRVNDKFGHDAGDDLLRAVADVLRRITEALPGSTAARLGGDEFCVVTVGQARAHVREVVAGTLEEFPLPHGAAVSYGLASTAITGAVPARQLFRRADAAQYRAKRARARLREMAVPAAADPAVTAERLVAAVSAAVAAAQRAVVARLCALAAAATDVLGGGQWAVLVRHDDEQPMVVARGGSPSDAHEGTTTLDVGYEAWTVQVGASLTAATGEPVRTTLEALVAVAARPA